MTSAARLFDYLRPWRGDYWRAGTYSVLNKLFDIAPEILIGVAVDVVVQREQSFIAELGLPDLEHQLIAIGVLTVLIWAGESFFQYLYQLGWRNLAQKVQHRLRAQVYDHLQHLPASELDRRRQGDLQTILTEDANQLERFLNDGISTIIHVVTSTLAVSAVFFAIAPSIAAFAMLPIPVIVVVGLRFQRGLALRYGDVRKSAGRLGARLTAQLHGLPTIRAYSSQAKALAALEQDSESYCEFNARAIRLSSAFVPIIRMAVLTGFVVTLVYGGFQTLDGALAVGAYSVLVFLTQRLLWPFTRLGETIDLYQRSMASATRLLDLLDLPRERTGGASPERLAAAGCGVVFEEVSFAYGDRAPALSELSLTIPERSFVGVVGSTGSGKSTLIKLLMGMYEPDHGRIAWGKQSIADLDLDLLRRRIGWVGQEVLVFHGTILENIQLSRPEASKAEVIEAAKVAEFHDFVAALPEGYETRVGDFGSALSGGQRQRLAIARAVLRDPELLILDEATSAVDNETEAAIQRSLADMATGRTVIAIAHRLSTIRRADQIFVLEGGRVAEQGTHDALVAAKGRYARLWAMQTGAHL